MGEETRPVLSYAQRFEDFYLMRCFGERPQGFYIDIGAGHPIFDNMSFAFYLMGWSGITVEPNPWLTRLSKAVRPRDHSHQALVSEATGEATFYVVDEFHGLSTMFERHARAAQTQFGKSSEAITVPVTTLVELCRQHAPAAIDFLKVDVEGAEKEVLFGGDWERYRPKIVVVEALAPYTLAPAWEQWEPLLVRHGYRYVWFDTLNRYYVAEEAGELARGFEDAPASFDSALQFRNARPALDDRSHPDHHLAALVARAAMTRLPLLDRPWLLELLTAGLSPAELGQPVAHAGVSAVYQRLFGRLPTPQEAAQLQLGSDATVRDVYCRLIDSDAFRVAAGRISASYAW